MSRSAPAPAAGASLDLPRVLFVGVLVLWMAYPVTLGRFVAQDAVPYVVAGELATANPGAIYATGGLAGLTPEFRGRSCPHYASDEQCAAFATAFVSPPPALPLAVGLSRLGDWASVALRVAGALGLVAAMAMVWRSLTAASRRAKWPLAIAAAALTPLAAAAIDLAQTSPILFVLAVAPLAAGAAAGHDAGRGAVLAAATALKVFPAGLALVLLAAGRRRELAWAVGVLAALAVAATAVAGPGVWRDFVTSSSALAQQARHSRFSGSIDSALDQLGVTSGAAAISLVFRAAVVALVAVVWRRRGDLAARWALTTAGLLLVFPQVWNHYLFAAVGAVAVAVSAHGAGTRAVWLVPAAALATVPTAVAGGGDTRLAVPLFATYVGLFAAVAWLLLRGSVLPASGGSTGPQARATLPA